MDFGNKWKTEYYVLSLPTQTKREWEREKREGLFSVLEKIIKYFPQSLWQRDICVKNYIYFVTNLKKGYDIILWIIDCNDGATIITYNHILLMKKVILLSKLKSYF